MPAAFLFAGRHVRILLDPDVQSPWTAEEVTAQPEKRERVVESIDGPSRTQVIAGQFISVAETATVLVQDLVNQELSLISLDEIVPGDTVACFGLTDCGGDPVFEAFVVVEGEG